VNTDWKKIDEQSKRLFDRQMEDARSRILLTEISSLRRSTPGTPRRRVACFPPATRMETTSTRRSRDIGPRATHGKMPQPHSLFNVPCFTGWTATAIYSWSLSGFSPT
jgi:hypothetical protein